jgi:hypothetical protein
MKVDKKGGRKGGRERKMNEWKEGKNKWREGRMNE